MDIKNQLIEWAKEYNTPAFIENDPVQFPRKYINNQVDAEVSGLLTALISFGNRKQIIKKAQEMDDMFNGSPSNWIINKEYLNMIPNDKHSFYHTISNEQFMGWCSAIEELLNSNGTLENAVVHNKHGCVSYSDLKIRLGFRLNSCVKRIYMFVRWMVRKDGIVDLGIWNSAYSRFLTIPLDTHVHRKALELGITKRKSTDINTAQDITDFFKTIWPNDPCLGDFALFGKS